MGCTFFESGCTAGRKYSSTRLSGPIFMIVPSEDWSVKFGTDSSRFPSGSSSSPSGVLQESGSRIGAA